MTNPFLAAAIGLCTGMMSGFFGIGDGPFQVAALMTFFNCKPKDAAVQSILITLLTMASSLAGSTINGSADFSLATYIILAAIIGGIIGAHLNKRFATNTSR